MATPSYGPPSSDPHAAAPERPDRGEHGVSEGSPVTPWLLAAALGALFTLGAWAIYTDIAPGETTWVGLLGTFLAITVSIGLVFVRIRRGKQVRNTSH